MENLNRWMISCRQAKTWQASFTPAERQSATQGVEQGKVVYFPNLPFQLEKDEQFLLSPTCLGVRSKNISFDPITDTLGGMGDDPQLRLPLEGMMGRFSRYARDFLGEILPHYRKNLLVGRTSYRPAEIAGRQTSYRKDDTRLHVDSFPSAPNQGKRILRVFCNVNPHGQSRVWRLGEPFEDVAKRFLPQLWKPFPGSSALLKALTITKSRRTAYDHYMLGLHDHMKADLAYQQNVQQLGFDFPPHSSWIVMTDHVSHAAMSGQYLLEQTFYLPVAAMQNEALSPLRVLEKMKGCSLV